MITDYVFTSQSVTEGHPDRLCDTISDAIVDAYLRQDPTSRITAECAISKNVLFLAARYASEAIVDGETGLLVDPHDDHPPGRGAGAEGRRRKRR